MKSPAYLLKIVLSVVIPSAITALYSKYMFIPIRDMSFTFSLLLFAAILAAVSYVGAYIDDICDNENDHLSSDFIIGCGIYTSISRFAENPDVILAASIISLILSAMFGHNIFSKKYPENKDKKQVSRKRKINLIIISRKLFFCSSAIVLLIISLSDINISGKNKLGTKDVTEETIESNLPLLVKLYDGTWENLDIDEKVGIMQTVADIEQNHLGIPEKLTVATVKMPEKQYGYYVNDNHRIYVSSDHIIEDDVWDVLDTVAHEAYHAYEHYMIDFYDKLDEQDKNLYLIRRFSAYKLEFENYESGTDSDNYEKYRDQLCESDARDYADEAVENYYSKIEEYAQTSG